MWLNLKIDITTIRQFKGYCEVRFFNDYNIQQAVSPRMNIEVLPEVKGVPEPFMVNKK